MKEIREVSTTPSGEDFRNAGGTPIVVDTAAKVAYAIDSAGSVFPVVPTSGFISAINLSAGTTSNNLSKVTFSNANGVTFGLNGSVLTASVAAAANPAISAGTSSASLGSIVFSNSNGVSFGLNGSTITGSIAAGTGGYPEFSAGTQRLALDLLKFQDSNGISFGLNGSTLTATVGTNYLTSQSNQALSGSNGSFTFQTATFGNLNGVSFYTSNGSLVASHNGLTTAMASNRGSDFVQATAAFAGTNASGTIASNGISVSVGNYLTTAMASNASTNFAGIGETTGTTAGTDLKMTVDTAGVNISFPKWITTAAASDHSHGNPTLALTNLTGTTASNSAGFTLSLSAAAPGAGGGAAISAGANSQNTGTVNFANSNGITFGLSNNGTMTASHNGLTTARASNDGVGLNTALTAGPLAWTVNSGGISLNAGSAAGTTTGFTGANISASMTHNTAGLAISASVAAPGGGAANTVSYYANARQFVNSQTMTFLQSTSHIVPFVVDENLSFAFMRIAASGSVLAASSTAATTGNTSYSAGHFRSHNLVIYSQGVGANSNSLQSYTSTQVTEAFRMTQSHNANSTQHSYTLNYTFPCSSGTTGFTKNYSSSAASLNYHTSHLTDLTGLKILEIPFAGSLSPGRYWLAYGISSTTSTARTADQSRQGIAFTALGMSQNTLAFGTLGAATNSSVMPLMPSGSFTTAGGGTTASVEFTRVSSSASHNQLFFQLMRVT